MLIAPYVKYFLRRPALSARPANRFTQHAKLSTRSNTLDNYLAQHVVNVAGRQHQGKNGDKHSAARGAPFVVQQSCDVVANGLNDCDERVCSLPLQLRMAGVLQTACHLRQ